MCVCVCVFIWLLSVFLSPLWFALVKIKKNRNKDRSSHLTRLPYPWIMISFWFSISICQFDRKSENLENETIRNVQRFHFIIDSVQLEIKVLF